MFLQQASYTPSFGGLGLRQNLYALAVERVLVNDVSNDGRGLYARISQLGQQPVSFVCRHRYQKASGGLGVAQKQPGPLVDGRVPLRHLGDRVELRCDPPGATP